MSTTPNSPIQMGRLSIEPCLYHFIEQQALPGSHISSADFWTGFEKLLAQHQPSNLALLNKRQQLQQQVDEYFKSGGDPQSQACQQFLKDIGYLQPQPQPFAIQTRGVDAEIANVAGPQLVVPINNARYALNAANARWGSLYDALYGTDVIDETDGAEKSGSYNPLRGDKVIAYAKQRLDEILPLAKGHHRQVTGFAIRDNQLMINLADQHTCLQNPQQWQGYQGNADAPTALLFKHNNLHIELQIDGNHPIGKQDPAGIKDVVLESALTTIMDCEDSVAAVDAEDKTLVYQNWLGLMQGNLQADMGAGKVRRLAADRNYSDAAGNVITLAGRSLMFVRNVGHLMTNSAILFDGQPIFEGIMDGVITALIGKHDLIGNSRFKNSREQSIYIVKPKMHGADEVAFTHNLFSDIEDLLGLPRYSLKMGIMDEERRTSLNLSACIKAAEQRVVFINTGFLDRTGDEIRTSMLAGVFAPKGELKQREWIAAYEDANVTSGIACGLSGKAQIGKGMWPIPDQMANMMQAKLSHPQSGANTAWVPSPTAATLHSLHYHQVDVFALRDQLSERSPNWQTQMMTLPLLETNRELSADEIQQELNNNIQGILGYVVRWVHMGIGCSKVPDINGVGLMEDRATLRISSQHIANWLEHGLVSEQQVTDALVSMAALVDQQNQQDKAYIPMGEQPQHSIAYQAAAELIFAGKAQPSGYTEPVLHAKRLEMKRRLSEQI